MDQFEMRYDGALNWVGDDDDAAEPVETNVTVFYPSNPTAFDSARDATLFTRLATHSSHQELAAALDAAPDLDETFCLSVNNVILVFSASHVEHAAHCQKVIDMLLAYGCPMCLDFHGSVFDAATSAAAGIRLDQVDEFKVYLVLNLGVPGR